MTLMMFRPALFAVALVTLAACGQAQEADRAYAREKCQAYGAEGSEAFRACADEALRYLYRTRSFQTYG